MLFADFIVAYEEKTELRADYAIERKKSLARKKFLMGLLRAGLEMERVRLYYLRISNNVTTVLWMSTKHIYDCENISAKVLVETALKVWQHSSKDFDSNLANCALSWPFFWLFFRRSRWLRALWWITSNFTYRSQCCVPMLRTLTLLYLYRFVH